MVPPLRSLSHISEVLPRVTPTRPQQLGDLVREFEAAETHEEDDTILPLADLRMEITGRIIVPVWRTYALTDWSRQQLATLLGIKWDRWFQTSDPTERAEEVNRRFMRAKHEVRLRTTRPADNENPTGTLRAFVSPKYTPIPDSLVAKKIAATLEPSDPELRIQRCDVTDKTTSYVVGVGRPFRGGNSAAVGDVWGGILVRNSGVGFASLMVSLSITRLICLNGMTAPITDAAFRQSHRALDEGVLDTALREHLAELPARFRRAGDVLGRASNSHVVDIEAEAGTVLRHGRLPQRLLPAVLDAWRREPLNSAFGVSQALTLAAQSQTPEVRVELERAAGRYLAGVAGTN